jgi:arsenical pump membrane protein
VSLNAEIWTWVITALTVAAVVIRPFKAPEALWAVIGAAALTLFGLLPWASAWQGVLKGTDVYFFLAGMMLLSETARREGLFDWLAGVAMARAKGSRRRLFALVYGLGILVTAVLSNDATAVVLTPAVLAVTRAAKAPPAPYLLACAMIANAASFLLPISNPANLVVFASHLPTLSAWMFRFLAPSAAAILVTFVILARSERSALDGRLNEPATRAALSSGGRAALIGLALTAVGLLIASSLGQPLGTPTFLLGALTAGVVLVRGRAAPWPLVRGVSWSVLPLVAGLFVLVQGLERGGLVVTLAGALARLAARSDLGAAALAGGLIALIDNLANNLPAGLIARTVLAAAHASARVTDAALIGVDLGPNLSVSGSLATILWLTALRREGQTIGFWRFLKVGVLVMPPALILAVGARLLIP